MLRAQTPIFLASPTGGGATKQPKKPGAAAAGEAEAAENAKINKGVFFEAKRMARTDLSGKEVNATYEGANPFRRSSATCLAIQSPTTIWAGAASAAAVSATLSATVTYRLRRPRSQDQAYAPAIRNPTTM